MADYLKSLLGGSKPEPDADDDFADFAGAPDPKPVSVVPAQPNNVGAHGAQPTLGAPPQILYTKWYRVWERTTPREFLPEAVILPFILVIVAFHLWGRRANKAKAKAWITAHAPILEKEYAQVGFGPARAPSVDDVQASGLANAMASTEKEVPEGLLKEKSAQEYISYASGRQNVAFTDVRISLYKRYNPATFLVEAALSFVFESIPPPIEKVDITSYAFDGREKELVPARTDEQKDSIVEQGKSKSSVYDPFVFSVVHKEAMKKLRDERYDVSLTVTRDHAKLPAWAAVMSESAEITEALLTKDLIKALETAGDTFKYLIITDQPIDKPQTIDETKPRKRMSLSFSLPSGSDPSSYEPTLPIFNYFLRLPDQLTAQAHFRPEVNRKIRTVREEEQKKLSKASEEEKAEERRLETEKKKREIRDKKLRGMSAEEQKKFLEKEKEKSTKKQEKKRTQKA